MHNYLILVYVLINTCIYINKAYTLCSGSLSMSGSLGYCGGCGTNANSDTITYNVECRGCWSLKINPVCVANAQCTGWCNYGRTAMDASNTYRYYYVCNGCACSSGYVNVNGQCCISNCPLGTIKSGCAVCTPCAPGTFSSTAAATACDSCIAGTYSQSRATKCIPCIPGTFSSVDRAETCTSCSPGYFLRNAGGTSCKACVQGTYSNTSGLVFCYSCSAGSYAENTTATACLLCSAGFFCNTTTATPCNTTMYCPAGSTAQLPCAAGPGLLAKHTPFYR